MTDRESNNTVAPRYRVTLCGTCRHPGGQHIHAAIDLDSPAPCRLCECEDFQDVGWNDAWWSDAMTEEARSGRR